MLQPRKPDPLAQMRDRPVMTAELAMEMALERAGLAAQAATADDGAAVLVITAVTTGRTLGGVPDLQFALKHVGTPEHLLLALRRLMPDIERVFGPVVASSALAQPITAAEPKPDATPVITAAIDALDEAADAADDLVAPPETAARLRGFADTIRRKAAHLRRALKGISS